MFCDEGLPFSLCSSILLFVALSLESIPLIIGFLLMTFMSNLQVYTYTIPLEKEKELDDKHMVAYKQKYKCFNFLEKDKDKYQCLLVDGTFDEAGYKLLGDKVYCPMCYSVEKKQNL